MHVNNKITQLVAYLTPTTFSVLIRQSIDRERGTRQSTRLRSQCDLRQVKRYLCIPLVIHLQRRDPTSECGRRYNDPRTASPCLQEKDFDRHARNKRPQELAANERVQQGGVSPYHSKYRVEWSRKIEDSINLHGAE